MMIKNNKNNNSAIYIEFIGAMGVGKSAIAKHLIKNLEEKKFSVLSWQNDFSRDFLALSKLQRHVKPIFFIFSNFENIKFITKYFFLYFKYFKYIKNVKSDYWLTLKYYLAINLLSKNEGGGRNIDFCIAEEGMIKALLDLSVKKIPKEIKDILVNNDFFYFKNQIKKIKARVLILIDVKDINVLIDRIINDNLNPRLKLNSLSLLKKIDYYKHTEKNNKQLLNMFYNENIDNVYLMHLDGSENLSKNINIILDYLKNNDLINLNYER